MTQITLSKEFLYLLSRLLEDSPCILIEEGFDKQDYSYIKIKQVKEGWLCTKEKKSGNNS